MCKGRCIGYFHVFLFHHTRQCKANRDCDLWSLLFCALVNPIHIQQGSSAWCCNLFGTRPCRVVYTSPMAAEPSSWETKETGKLPYVTATEQPFLIQRLKKTLQNHFFPQRQYNQNKLGRNKMGRKGGERKKKRDEKGRGRNRGRRKRRRRRKKIT